MNIDFYNVQRLALNTHPRPAAVGFDRQFTCEYMGNASYEYGVAPSLRRIRATADLGIRRYQLTIGEVTRTVHLFGHVETLDEQFAGLTAWANGDSGRQPFAVEELTYFDKVFLGTAPDYCETVAWWSLAGDIMWSLDADVAEKIASAVVPAQALAETCGGSRRQHLPGRVLGQ